VAAETAAAGLFLDLRCGGATGFSLCPSRLKPKQLHPSIDCRRLSTVWDPTVSLTRRGLVGPGESRQKRLWCRESEQAGVSSLERIATEQKSKQRNLFDGSVAASEDAAIGTYTRFAEARVGQPSSNRGSCFSQPRRQEFTSSFFNPVEGGEISLVFFDILTLTLLENTSNCSRCCKQF